MNDKVLSDEEKDALLDGVESGEIEVRTNSGPVYAAVEDFQIAARCRLHSNSFPRLQRLNHRLATRFSKQTEQLVSAEAEVEARDIRLLTYGDYCEQRSEHCLVVEFSAEPLDGAGIVSLNAELVEFLVHAFYGGGHTEEPRTSSEFFTRGETSVATRFCKDLFSTLSEVWQPLMETRHEQVTTHLGSDLIEGLDPSDKVVCADFDVRFLKQEQTFSVVWPVHMLSPLLPVFEGQKRERDPAEDSRWEQAIRNRLVASTVGISSRVGNATLTLGQIADLKPGDIIDIDSPRASTVFVDNVPILRGQFGVHEGQYAIEADGWLAHEADTVA